MSARMHQALAQREQLGHRAPAPGRARRRRGAGRGQGDDVVREDASRRPARSIPAHPAASTGADARPRHVQVAAQRSRQRRRGARLAISTTSSPGGQGRAGRPPGARCNNRSRCAWRCRS
jgi:hypothetical protein